MEQPARHGIVNARNAVVTAGLLIAAKFVLGLVEIDEAADKEVQLAVIVVVEPDRARSPSGSGKACFASDVGKRAVAIIMIKNDAVILGDKKIGETVAVVVPDGNSHPIAKTGNASPFGHVGKAAIAIVVIKRVT